MTRTWRWPPLITDKGCHSTHRTTHLTRKAIRRGVFALWPISRRPFSFFHGWNDNKHLFTWVKPADIGCNGPQSDRSPVHRRGASTGDASRLAVGWRSTVSWCHGAVKRMAAPVILKWSALCEVRPVGWANRFHRFLDWHATRCADRRGFPHLRPDCSHTEAHPLPDAASDPVEACERLVSRCG